jgi:hypothetical protein
MRVIALLHRNAVVLTIIVVIAVIATVKILNHTKQLHYEREFNELIMPLINEKNNEKIFYATNVESDPKQYKNVLDISGGGLRNTRFVVYLLRLNNYYLDKNIDMLRMFNVFGGVSAGAIITGAIAYREHVLKNCVKNDKSSLIECMKMFKYTDAQITKCIEWILHDSRELNYGTLILQWMVYEFISLRDKLFNVSVFDRITTLNGYLHPQLSSSDKRAYLKRYFDFDIKSILKTRKFITCAIKIANEKNVASYGTVNEHNYGTPNQIIVFTNSEREFNSPNLVTYDHVVTNVADIIHISTHTIGVYPVCAQYPFAWDATAYMNNISTLIIPLFLNHSVNPNLNYFGLSNIKNLTYEKNEGILWWIHNVDALVRIQTKYNMQMMKFLQKTKYHNVIIDRGGNHAFDTSTDAMLNDIRNGSGVSINDSVKFIRDEMSSANHNLFDNM